ncbi:hypothetical protein GEV33_013831 [Tenebrio molitor]|uniref:Fibronectin type-III domain-containing protein n=1 Tax=Tenebrio molitor TaxID=7067 RepID=A0A8J6GZF3_TENMO|nr:hypothetical protein GEV33_013831 [Tenebrio molitor]
MIGLSEKATCQLMSDDKKIITFKDSLQVSESKCPESSIGEFCVPCKWIYESCKGTKICDNDKCVCSSGYTNKDCYYGKNAKVEGTITDVKNLVEIATIQGAITLTEHAPPALMDSADQDAIYVSPSIIFAKAPDVTDVKYTEATVQVTNFTLDSSSDNSEKPDAYAIQYKVERAVSHVSYVACKQLPTTPSTERTLRVTETSTTIKDLIPYSKYLFSVFAENTKFKGLPSEFLEETLAAEEIESEEISEVTVTPGTHGVNIELSPICEKIRGQLVVNTTVICDNEWCKNQNRTKTTNHYVSNEIITLDKLTPFSDYSLDLIFCRNYTNCEGSIKKETFRTKPTVPNAVTDLLVYTKNESSASLRWKPPYPPTGVLQKYKIEYYNAHSNRIKDFKMTSCKIDSAEVFPSTQYKVQVSAFNGVSGHYVLLVDTSPPDIPLLNGDPESNSTNDTITLKISLQKPRGQSDNRRLVILIKSTNLKATAANYSLIPSQDNITETIGDIHSNNFLLEPGTSYKVTILLLNTFQNKTRSKEYSYLYKTSGGQDSSLLGLLVLLVIIPIAVIIYKKRDKLLSLKNDRFKRNNTSLIPPGECENAVPKNQNSEMTTTADILVYSRKVENQQFFKYVKTCMQTKQLEEEHQVK